RKVFENLDSPWNFVIRKLRATKCQKFLFRCWSRQGDRRINRSFSARIFNTKHGGFSNLRATLERMRDFKRRHFEAAYVNHVIHAACHVKEAVAVHHSSVSHAKRGSFEWRGSIRRSH